MKKRIALGVVAALAMGLLGAVTPASANTQDRPWRISTPVGTFNSDSSTATVEQIASTGGFVEITAAANETTVASASWIAVSGSTFTANTGVVGTMNTAKTRIDWDTTTITNAKVRVATEAAGTITVTAGYLKVDTGVVTSVLQQTFTITVVAAATSSLYDNTELGSVETAVSTAYIASSVVYHPVTTGTQRVATVKVTQWANAAKTTKTATASTKAITASVSGVGLISETASSSTVGYVAIAAGAANDQSISIWGDGRAGVATVTISVDGKVIGTRSVTFVGKGANYAVKQSNPHVMDAETGTVTVTVTDSNGIVVVGERVFAVSDSASVATVVDSATTSSSGVATFTVTGVDPGKATLTFRNASTSTAATVSGTAAQTVTKTSASTVTMAFDKATYAPGEKATITVTVKDADGVLIGDKGSGATTSVFSADVASSAYISGGLPTAAFATASGVKTFTIYMPLQAGPVNLSAKLASDTTKEITAAATVVVPASAQETANAAAITALQTSVAALQTTVASLVASLTAQIRVINAALAKIARAMKVKL